MIYSLYPWERVEGEGATQSHCGLFDKLIFCVGVRGHVWLRNLQYLKYPFQYLIK